MRAGHLLRSHFLFPVTNQSGVRIERCITDLLSSARDLQTGSVLCLTLRVFATWRLCVKLFSCTGDLTQRRKAAKKNREVRHYLQTRHLCPASGHLIRYEKGEAIIK
jgi:hypothetical protein